MKSKDFEIRTPFLGVGDPLVSTRQSMRHMYTDGERQVILLLI